MGDAPFLSLWSDWLLLPCIAWLAISATRNFYLGYRARHPSPAPGGATENAQGHMETNPPAAGRGEGDSHG